MYIHITPFYPTRSKPPHVILKQTEMKKPDSYHRRTLSSRHGRLVPAVRDTMNEQIVGCAGIHTYIPKRKQTWCLSSTTYISGPLVAEASTGCWLRAPLRFKREAFPRYRCHRLHNVMYEDRGAIFISGRVTILLHLAITFDITHPPTPALSDQVICKPYQ